MYYATEMFFECPFPPAIFSLVVVQFPWSNDPTNYLINYKLRMTGKLQIIPMQRKNKKQRSNKLLSNSSIFQITHEGIVCGGYLDEEAEGGFGGEFNEFEADILAEDGCEGERI